MIIVFCKSVSHFIINIIFYDQLELQITDKANTYINVCGLIFNLHCLALHVSV